MFHSHSEPWHHRQATSKHHHWYRNLVDLHELTNAWLNDLKVDRPSHFMTRGLKLEVTENLWMLDSMAKTEIDRLLDDTRPDDTLSRLEHTVWTVQAWTLVGLIEKVHEKERPAFNAILEQTSWRLGRQCAERRWQGTATQAGSDLRALILAMMDSPVSGYPHMEAFMVKRALPHEVQVELRMCPHQTHYHEVKAAADDLCRLHTHWMRGFAYALNNRISIEGTMGQPQTRCLQRWVFVT